jgi:hypothetical protein
MILLEIDNPSPIPAPVSDFVENFVNNLGNISGSIPLPVSSTLSLIALSSSELFIFMDILPPPSLVNLTKC